MTHNTYAVIEAGIVTNLIWWDGDEAKWTPPADAQVVKLLPWPAPGWTYDGESFQPPA